MKTAFIILILALVIIGCDNKTEYPRYSLTSMEVVDDSLQEKYQEWIIRESSALSLHMTGGDYEDVDETAYAIKRIADRIFAKKKLVLRVEIDNNYFNDLILTEKEMNEKQKQIFKGLIKDI